MPLLRAMLKPKVERVLAKIKEMKKEGYTDEEIVEAILNLIETQIQVWIQDLSATLG